MNTCKSCKYYTANQHGHLGSCSRWHEGYYVQLKEIASNEVLVENDEGWGAHMGPDFGCVLHELKHDANAS